MKYKYDPRENEKKIVGEYFSPGFQNYVRSTCDGLASLLDAPPPTVMFDSSPNSTEESPAYRAFIALGLPTLPWAKERLKRSLKWKDGEHWWLIMALQHILTVHNIDLEKMIPESAHGRNKELAQAFMKILNKVLAPKGMLREWITYDSHCACGRKGEWIADGIARTGFYCKKCSDKALEEA